MTQSKAKQPSCDVCPWRQKYDTNPMSFLGRLWKFHIRFCPGWKVFMQNLPTDQQQEIRKKYNIK